MYNEAEFKQELINTLAELFPDCKIEKVSYSRNGSELTDALILKGFAHDGANEVSPSIYYKDLYTDYCNGRSMEDIKVFLKTLLNARERFTTPFIGDVEKSICITMYDKKYRPNIEDYITKDFLGVTAALTMIWGKEDNPECMCRTLLSEEARRSLISQEWSDEKLWALAKSNSLKCTYTLALLDWDFCLGNREEVLKIVLKPHFLESEKLISALKEYSQHAGEPAMYVLENESCGNGTMALLNDKLLYTLAKGLNSDLWLLPSSIYEFIVVPVKQDSEGMTNKAMQKMVKDVNGVLNSQELFTDSVFMYKLKTRSLINLNCEE